ncbi:hypothetical protein D3C87_2112620 [compost metagenome]
MVVVDNPRYEQSLVFAWPLPNKVHLFVAMRDVPHERSNQHCASFALRDLTDLD